MLFGLFGSPGGRLAVRLVADRLREVAAGASDDRAVARLRRRPPVLSASRAPPTSSAVATRSATPLAICWLANDTFMIARPFCSTPRNSTPSTMPNTVPRPPAKDNATQQYGGQGTQFDAHSKAARRGGVDARDGDYAGETSRRTAHDKQQKRNAANVDAREIGRFLVHADRIDVPPAGGEFQEHATHDADGGGDPDRDRNAQEIARPELAEAGPKS